MVDVNRPELAKFLRTRRERLRPTEVGLVDSGRRRTPGLRRQEVAELAGMSVDYYIRLEQGRGPRPSRQVLSALGRALLLTADEREYLFHLAAETPPLIAGPSRELPPSVLRLLDMLDEAPAYVVDAKYDILAWNRLARYFVGEKSHVVSSERNMIRASFTRPDLDAYLADEQAARFLRATVADLRAAYGRYPGDPGIQALVTELQAISPRFAEIWAEHDVEVRRRMRKRVEHPLLGALEFDCQVLLAPDSDQRIVIYTADAGSPTQHAFQRLGALADADDNAAAAADQAYEGTVATGS